LPDGDGTAVEIELRGWYGVGAQAGEERTGYASGLEMVLAAYAKCLT